MTFVLNIRDGVDSPEQVADLVKRTATEIKRSTDVHADLWAQSPTVAGIIADDEGNFVGDWSLSHG